MNTQRLLEYSYINKLSHIPSALSMLDYIDVLFTEKHITLDDGIVIGKPFGAQAYYLVWEELGLIDNIEQLSVGVKHDEILFVNYGEETMGNALGVAAGLGLFGTADYQVIKKGSHFFKPFRSLVDCVTAKMAVYNKIGTGTE